MEQTVSDFLALLKIPISPKYIEKLIQAHPDFPSLLSISDIFLRLGINHQVTRIEKERLPELPFPYLIPLDKGRGDIIVIKNGDSLKKYENQLGEWSGVVVLAETTKTTTDKENNDLYYQESKIRKYAISIILALAALLLLSFINSFSWVNAFLLVMSIAGLAVGYLLFAKELGISYAAVDAFCNAGKNTNCDKVLTSEVTLLGVSFSDAVLTYFLFQTITLGFSSFLPGQAQPILFPLATLSLLTLPVVIFSFYYQYVKAKTWCRLCLIVDAILILQTYLFGYSIYNDAFMWHGISGVLLIVLALVVLAIYSSVLAIKASIERYEKLNQQGGVGNGVKHTASVFASFLTRQKKIDTQPFETEMLLGNSDVPIKIIMASNLYCNPCKKKHEVADQLVAMYPDKVNITLRFIRSGNDVVYKTESLRHLLGYWHQFIHGKDDESQNTLKLMNNWFTLWDLQKFMKIYPTKPDDAEVEKLEAQHYTWIDEVGITHTPTFFINGYELPKEYIIEDLLAMTPALADSINKTAESEMTLQHV